MQKLSGQDDKTLDGSEVAHWFKYLSNRRLFHNLRREKFEYISYCSLYRRKQQLFDKLAAAFKKSNVDIIEYLKFCVNSLNISEETITRLGEQFTVQQYAESLQIQMQRKKIYNWYLKSVEFVSMKSAAKGLTRTVESLKDMIKTRKLAAYYIAGNISKYYFAAIPKFPMIVQKMDHISQDEFSYLCSMYEKLHEDIREAVIQETGAVPDVFALTDTRISEKLADFALQKSKKAQCM